MKVKDSDGTEWEVDLPVGALIYVDRGRLYIDSTWTTIERGKAFFEVTEE
jgi:hypothetical protein